jgi:hypothetical protein
VTLAASVLRCVSNLTDARRRALVAIVASLFARVTLSGHQCAQPTGTWDRRGAYSHPQAKIQQESSLQGVAITWSFPRPLHAEVTPPWSSHLILTAVDKLADFCALRRDDSVIDMYRQNTKTREPSMSGRSPLAESEHFRPGPELKNRIENFRRPRALPRNVALRVLLNAALEIVERGETIPLHDPLRDPRPAA